MHVIEHKEIEKMVNILAAGLLQQPDIAFRMEGVEDAEALLQLYASSKIRGFLAKGDVFVYDKCKGILIGYFSKDLNLPGYLMVLRMANNYMVRCTPKGSVRKIIKNGKLLRKIDDPSWQAKVCEGSYYFIEDLVIAPLQRHKGCFRQMVEGLIENCDENKVAILTECSSEKNVEIWKHFGFELVETKSHPKVPVKKYLLIKKPTGYKEKEIVTLSSLLEIKKKPEKEADDKGEMAGGKGNTTDGKTNMKDGGGDNASVGGGAAPQSAGGGDAPQSVGGGDAPQSVGGGAAPQSAGGGAAPQSVGGGAAPQSVGGGAAPLNAGEENGEANA